MQSFEFQSKIKGLSYSNDSNKISKLEEFDHKMIKLPLLLTSHLQKSFFFGVMEQINLLIQSAIKITRLNDEKPPCFDR